MVGKVNVVKDGAKSLQSPGSNQAISNPDLSSISTTFSFKILKFKTKQQELLIRVIILGRVYILAFITRIFSVLRYESMIHEFHFYFNYRTTNYLTKKGFYEFWNWFDSESWYPIGRIIRETLYPVLMVTSAIIYWNLKFLRFAVHIREFCVVTGSFFASNTTIDAYFFRKEVWESGAGLVVAALITMCPGHISRLVVKSYC